MLITAALISLGIGLYLNVNGPGKISIRSANGHTLVSHDDIIFVDWGTQTFQLNKTGIDKLIMASDARFQFCVDENVIYIGSIISPLVSSIPPGPLIYCSQFSTDFTIEGSNPVEIQFFRGPLYTDKDPRFRHRIYTSLWASGKLTNDG